MNKSLTLLILFTLFLAFFSGCEKEVKVSGIIVEPKNVYLSKGDVVQLACLVTPYSADNKSVRWSSKDDAIATVSQTGLVTAIAEGKTRIAATTKDGNFSDTVSVIVARGSPAGDSIALIKLYEIAENLNWNLTKPMDTWEGVVLNSNRRVIYINHNDFIYISKNVDSTIGNLAYLKSLFLSAAYAIVDVTIPVEIGLLKELQELILCEGFTGTIPLELGSLSNLEWLDIYHNKITGGIPKELGNLNNLKSLFIFFNDLAGKIPEELGNLSKLESLNLWGNKLTGEIPEELGYLVELEKLSLEYNQLNGEIPKTLGNLNKLYYLNLTYNSLSGPIPQSLLDRFEKWSFCPQKGTKFDNLDCSGY